MDVPLTTSRRIFLGSEIPEFWEHVYYGLLSPAYLNFFHILCVVMILNYYTQGLLKLKRIHI